MTRDDKINIAVLVAVLIWAALVFPGAEQNYREAREDAAIARAVWGMGKR